MGSEFKQTQYLETDTAISHIRSSLLVLAQTGEWSDLTTARSVLACLREQAEKDGQISLSNVVAECESSIGELISESPPLAHSIYGVLDRISTIEAALLDSSLHSTDFLDDLSSLVDATFESPAVNGPVAEIDETPESFAIDEETLDIFRNEASELLTAIDKSLATLVRSPSNSQAVWEIRRCAHTFKGAAGIVGYKNGCTIAHRMEDLLDVVVASKQGVSQPILDFLTGAVNALHSILEGSQDEVSPQRLELQYSDAVRSFSGSGENDSSEPQPFHLGGVGVVTACQPVSSPVIRVAVDRLDHLSEVSKKLTAQNAAIIKLFGTISENEPGDIDQLPEIAKLLDSARALNQELDAGLQRIRMVRFGTIETRLSRAVNNTCIDERKRASLTLENGDLEIDTLVIDALIEPLIHLLKNAVVHGIETPETRRLIGKPDTGSIRIAIDADQEALVLTVSDDGGGISVARLKERAAANAVLTEAELSTLGDRDALKLIFEKGVTTADRIDLNAGRGVGMAIVKECIESRGGSVLVDSAPQKGTTFTVLMPMCPRQQNDDVTTEPARAEEPDPLILIVDDSASIRNQAVRVVEHAGFRTITANNGAEALELLLSGKWEPNLIVSDVEMPQIDGWELLEYIKTDDNFGGIPVVMMTSLDSPKYRQRAFDLGASDYVVKPVRSTDLVRVCQEQTARD